MEKTQSQYVQRFRDLREIVYIQFVFALPDDDKASQELNLLTLKDDSFPKNIVRKVIRKR